MANRHYAEIGDLWKHLPLAEILSLEQPRLYCETHAGSAQYHLTHSWERDYGFFQFFAEAKKFPALQVSQYLNVLRTCQGEDENLSIYPGSPQIAMRLRGNEANYAFCDLDDESLDNIKNVAQRLQIPATAVQCFQADGIDAIAQFVSQSHEHASEILVHIDPYRPLEIARNNLNSIDLFYELSKIGVKTILWYGYDAQEREILGKVINKTLTSKEITVSTQNLWCGEIYLLEINNPNFSLNPGVMGCGVLCSNLSPKTVAACIKLGEELVYVYENSVFPNGLSGAISYRSISL
ncbi:MAG: 23S rRNA (adenine(2030)-N(6))-methyltransferase RlmJ [Rhizonema sp. PD38]|nr:23S rRNA (adenine(2030)-N(6))-methyltransferase RlmJ [Rhizonema sp. PD38]